MSENLDLVRSIYAGWERGDFSSAAWADPEIEFVLADGPDPGTSIGLDVMAKRWRERIHPWQGLIVTADELRELDDGRVLVLLRQSGRGKTSGLDVGQMPTKNATLFQVRDGKVVRLVVYWDCDRAFADLGLEQ
jgi:ketosteroid isomerase-like protein